MRTILDSLSDEGLEKLCRVAYWMDLGGARVPEWEATRAERERHLGGLDPGLVRRFQRFLAAERRITVPGDHAVRLANLPEVVARVARDAGLAVSPEDSELLLRWATWNGDLPRHVVWWWTPPDELPAT